jgi:hypothetical protein
LVQYRQRLNVICQDAITSSNMTVPDYETAIAWIVREHGGGGGHPLRNRASVCGWITTRMTAKLFNKSVNEVAGDVVDLAAAIDDQNFLRRLDAREAAERQKAERRRKRQGERAKWPKATLTTPSANGATIATANARNLSVRPRTKTGRLMT